MDLCVLESRPQILCGSELQNSQTASLKNNRFAKNKTNLYLAAEKVSATIA